PVGTTWYKTPSECAATHEDRDGEPMSNAPKSGTRPAARSGKTRASRSASADGNAALGNGTRAEALRSDSHDLIRVVGAQVNNLKSVSVEIPKRRLTVFTGVSGSGKSSLVFGTIAAESQRLINETY